MGGAGPAQFQSAPAVSEQDGDLSPRSIKFSHLWLRRQCKSDSFSLGRAVVRVSGRRSSGQCACIPSGPNTNRSSVIDAGLGRRARGAGIVEGLVVIACVTALALGLKQMAAQQAEVLRGLAAKDEIAWQIKPGTWNDQAEAIYRANPTRSTETLTQKIDRWLPVHGADWALLQPLPHALSYLSGLKPLKDLVGFQRSGLGIPVQVEP